MDTDTPVTTTFARYIAEARRRELPGEIAERAKQAVLDGLVAMISGATLRPGRLATAYARSRGGVGEATLVGDGTRTNPELAALAGGMAAHADETDDVHDAARVHAGASIVPAALASGEHHDRSGADLVAAVTVGYDAGCSVNLGAFDSLPAIQGAVRTPHGLGQAFGAAAAASSLAGLDLEQTCYMLSYTAQQVSGISSFYRDQEHVGKAFASAGMQAHTGVRAAEMVAFGFTDIADVFDTSPHAFEAFGHNADTGRLLAHLGTHHVATTDVKQYPIGMPIQAPAEALERICREEGIGVDDVEAVEARLPTFGARIVDSRTMPDISLQYVLAVILVDGGLTFESAHDYERHRRPETREVMDRITLVGDEALEPPADLPLTERRSRVATVTVTTRDGRQISEHVDAPRGSRHNPLSWEGMAGKAHMVLDGVMGREAVDDLVATVGALERLDSVRALRPFLGSG